MKTKFKEVTVFIKWSEICEIEDFLRWTDHMYRIPNITTDVVYRGFIPEKELRDIYTLQAVSPYGASYVIIEDKTLKEALEIYRHMKK